MELTSSSVKLENAADMHVAWRYWKSKQFDRAAFSFLLFSNKNEVAGSNLLPAHTEEL